MHDEASVGLGIDNVELLTYTAADIQRGLIYSDNRHREGYFAAL